MSDEECEAAVVAGNIPEAPPAPSKPTAPAGTTVVPSLVKRTHQLGQCLDVIRLVGGMDL